MCVYVYIYAFVCARADLRVSGYPPTDRPTQSVSHRELRSPNVPLYSSSSRAGKAVSQTHSLSLPLLSLQGVSCWEIPNPTTRLAHTYTRTHTHPHTRTDAQTATRDTHGAGMASRHIYREKEREREREGEGEGEGERER
eukprot:GHVU01026773.1.p1 GENE.GHVU01026773.1~~GHVU01026773.1.p1  ORF type:complete len:140 (-),score=11.90 GHVU01026773.1:36-455(-)